MSAPALAPIDMPPPARPGTIAVAGHLALAVAIGIGRFAFTPMLPMMQEDAGVSVVAGGWLAAANYVGYLLGALSMISRRRATARAIRSGLLTIGLTTLTMGLVSDFRLWVVLRALAGVASAWVLIGVSAVGLQQLAAAGTPALRGVVFAGVGTGITLAGVLCLVLMHVHAGSRLTWIAFGILALVLSGAIMPRFSAADRAPLAPAAEWPSRRLLWDAEWTRLVLCYGIFGFGYIVPATFLPVMARQVIRDPAVFGWSWPVFGMAAALSALVAALAPGTTNRRLWIAGHLVLGLGIVLPVGWSGIAAIMLAALLVGGTFMVITMVGMQEAREVAGVRATSLMAAMTSAFALGQIAGPMVVSLVAGRDAGLTGVLVSASSLLAISAWALSRSRSRATVRR
jgi:predicted MFS family arabinose efflux permease